MFKSTVVSLSLLFLSASIQAEPANLQSKDGQAKVNAVAQRLASKNINEILQATMKLQLDCQRLIDEDTCSGVKTMLAVLDLRITNSGAAISSRSEAFLKGLMSGIEQANNSAWRELKTYSNE